MTNHTDPAPGALGPEPVALITGGDTRRPVKVVQHPAFRGTRPHAALEAPLTVLRLPVVSLNREPAASNAGRRTSLFILGPA